MKISLNQKSHQYNSKQLNSSPAAGSSAESITPPAYGIEAIDNYGSPNALVHQSQSSHLNNAVIQRVGDEAGVRAIQDNIIEALTDPTFLDWALQLLIQLIKWSGLPHKKQEALITKINTIRNLLRYKKELDPRSKTQRYAVKLLKVIKNLDPLNIIDSVLAIEKALSEIQTTLAMIEEYKQGTAVPLDSLSSSRSTYGTFK